MLKEWWSLNGQPNNRSAIRGPRFCITAGGDQPGRGDISTAAETDSIMLRGNTIQDVKTQAIQADSPLIDRMEADDG